jgi:KUP system potassium uptake protein
MMWSAAHASLAPSNPLPATLAALGIVYGDIGTSPLYAFKQAVDASEGLSRAGLSRA